MKHVYDTDEAQRRVDEVYRNMYEGVINPATNRPVQTEKDYLLWVEYEQQIKEEDEEQSIVEEPNIIDDETMCPECKMKYEFRSYCYAHKFCPNCGYNLEICFEPLKEMLSSNQYLEAHEWLRKNYENLQINIDELRRKKDHDELKEDEAERGYLKNKPQYYENQGEKDKRLFVNAFVFSCLWCGLFLVFFIHSPFPPFHTFSFGEIARFLCVPVLGMAYAAVLGFCSCIIANWLVRNKYSMFKWGISLYFLLSIGLCFFKIIY